MEYLSYSPDIWNKVFASERDNLLFELPQFKIKVEHIGATSVKNCRSFRNVDILVIAKNFKDISTIAMILSSKDYKELRELSSIYCALLVKKSKVLDCGITVRVVEYGSKIYNRINCFQTYLKKSGINVQQYNIFREESIRRSNMDITKYNKTKYDYINLKIDENFRFE